jgi:hypothetical protein
MMRSMRLLILAVALAVAGAGCETVKTARTVNDLDDRLQAIIGERSGGDAVVARRVTSPEALADLASLGAEAAERAPGAATEADRIAFYRIAAVALWKAGEAGEGRIVEAVGEGTAACGRAAPPPARDCAVIALALPAASIDDARRKLDALEAANARGEFGRDQFGGSVAALDDMLAATQRMLEARPAAADAAVSPDLRRYVDRQVERAYCHVARAHSFAIEMQERPDRLLPPASHAEFQRVQAATAEALGGMPGCLQP